MLENVALLCEVRQCPGLELFYIARREATCLLRQATPGLDSDRSRFSSEMISRFCWKRLRAGKTRVSFLILLIRLRALWPSLAPQLSGDPS